MDRLSPLAWAAIAIIVLVAALVNIWMVALFRNKDLRDQQLSMKRPTGGISMENMQKFVRVVRNPFIDEQEQLTLLSKRVQDLKDREEDRPRQP